MKKKYAEIMKLIKEEIRWHNCNWDKTLGVNKYYHVGFVEGLKQANFLIEQLQQADEKKQFNRFFIGCWNKDKEDKK